METNLNKKVKVLFRDKLATFISIENHKEKLLYIHNAIISIKSYDSNSDAMRIHKNDSIFFRLPLSVVKYNEHPIWKRIFPILQNKAT